MKRFWISWVVVAAFSWPACGQKVEVEKPDRGQILHVKTALDHLTVLEMSEPVSTVAVGSPVFKVEWRGNKVFIEPTETHVATNLFVWTPSGRFNYELDPAGAVPQMDFAIDQPVVDRPVVTRSARAVAKPSDPSPAEVLIEVNSVRLYGPISDKNPIAVYVTDLLEQGGQVLIRYTIRNRAKEAYVPGTPQVVALTAPRYSESLYVLRNFELSPDAARHMKSSGETPLKVMKSEMRSPRIGPDQETTGIVAIKLPPPHAEPTVLRLVFLAGPKGSVSATLVL
ncbi:MAG: TrbG/VirB9 family P-type conjugative transfer protein [Candidatus Acidiferrales bacterium]